MKTIQNIAKSVGVCALALAAAGCVRDRTIVGRSSRIENGYLNHRIIYATETERSTEPKQIVGIMTLESNAECFYRPGHEDLCKSSIYVTRLPEEFWSDLEQLTLFEQRVTQQVEDVRHTRFAAFWAKVKR